MKDIRYELPHREYHWKADYQPYTCGDSEEDHPEPEQDVDFLIDDVYG